MKVNNINYLIENKLHPNVSEWCMEVKDALEELGELTPYLDELLNRIKRNNLSWHKSFPENSDEIVAVLKRITKKYSNEKLPSKEVTSMTNKNIFIIYSHQQAGIMREIKEFIADNLQFNVETLNISECTGSVWDAFVNKSKNCEKAVVLMTNDDNVINANGQAYWQARPNVFIELGYMICKCGLQNVTIVRTQECNVPSDINGLISVIYNSDKWTESLRKQLNR